MQSFNKIPSFGDDTLGACIQAEMKNIDIFNNRSDMDKYFEDNAFLTKVSVRYNKSNNIHAVNELSEILHGSADAQSTLNENNLKHKELITDNVTKSKFTTKTSQTNRSKMKMVVASRKNFVLSKHNKENVNLNVNYIESNISLNTNILQKQCNRSEFSALHIDNSNVKSNAMYSTTIDATNVKSSNDSSATSTVEKSSKEMSSISVIPTQDRCNLASWGLPPNILKKYEARGVTTMFTWQVECLSNHKVIEEMCNLVYSAPTSAGKTLVAEILMIKTVLERQKKVIFILPFVSVVREKMYYFQDLLSDSGVRVEGFMGGAVPRGGFAATHVAIATIEKANSLINRLMEENELLNLGAVIIDELHLVGDPNRGYLLELLLTKLKFMTFRDKNINIQLIGMSATLPNLSLLAKWLDAELYKTEFRPVPLNEQCKIGKNIYDNKLCLIRRLTPMPELTMDSDDILHLCVETISDGHSVLIFCPTKNWCETLAQQIATAFCRLGREDTQLGKTLRQQLDSQLISETLEQLKRSPTGLDNVLESTISFGTAFHHAGLTMDERDIIEGSFRSGSLRVLVATSTLSSGVNLPARRVIIRTLMFGGKLLDSLTYRQMIGRAGRMGKDTAGESILICKSSEQKGAETLLSASLKPIESCLEDSGPLIRALLEAIASEVVYTPSDLELYTKCTLVSLTGEHHSKDPSYEAIKFLIDNEFLLLQKTEEGHRWVATAFGKACLAASIPPREGLLLLEALQKARRCFVLDTELHVVYLVTPINSGSQIGTIDWMTFFELWKMLSESERRVGQLVGVEERYLTSAIKGIVRPGKLLGICRRFYTALALHDLVREVPLNTVCKKYGCCRGLLQSLQQSASTFAGMVTQFCKQLGWDCMELLVSQFQTRLQFGVCRELLDLLRLPMLNGLRARSLYKHGITSVADLAVADELDVERALHKAVPFESEKEQEGEHESEAVKRNKMRSVFVTGKDGLTPHEAAVMLVREARTLVQNELGLQDISWKKNEQSVITNESNSDVNLLVRQGTLQPLERANVHIQLESTYNNSASKINSSKETIQDKRKSNSSITIDQSVNKDINSIGREEEILNSECVNHEKFKLYTNVTENVKCLIIDKTIGKDTNSVNIEKKSLKLKDKFCKNEKSKIYANLAENAKGSKCDLVNVPQDIKNDGVKLTDQLLQIDIPDFIDSPAEKLFFDFFEDSSPKIIHDSQKRRNSESLINFKDSKKNRTHNFSTKHSVDDVQNVQNTSRHTSDIQNTSDIPAKKIRMSNEIDVAQSICGNTIRRLPNFENGVMSSVSRSPSLFDESLNLDTQICNVLEQNVVDSLHFSEFENSKLSERKVTTENKMNVTLLANHTVHDETEAKRGTNEETVNKNSINLITSKTKNSALSWKDDSWNEPQKLTEKLSKIKEKSNEDTLAVKCGIRNIKNTNIQHTVEAAGISNSTPEMKRNQDIKFETSMNTPDNVKKISQRRRFKDIPVVKSPITNVIVFSKNRAPSLDSNKSDSDDIVIASQNMNSPVTSVRIRSILDSARNQRIQTQKVLDQMSDDKRYATPCSETLQVKKRKIKPKLNDILAENLLISKKYSTDSVVSNSDDDTPIKSVKVVQKSKIATKKDQKTPKMCIQANELVDNLNEGTNWNTLNVIKVGSDRGTFNLFKREVMQKRYVALALNCELYNDEASNIGFKIISSTMTEKKKRSKKVENYVHVDKKLCGAAIAWAKNIAYYISFCNESDLKISGKEQMKLLKELLSNSLLYVKCFATKETFKTLYQCCDIIANCKFLDPKVANWLYDGNIYENNFNDMVKEYFPQGNFITKKIGACYDTGPGLDTKSAIPGEFRASAESVLTWHVTDTLLDKLEELSPTLLYTFKDIEMKIVTVLACMELTGLGVSLKSLQDLSCVIRDEMTSLEERAYKLSGKKFNFSSSKEVGEVLGLYKGKKISVNKAVLGQCDHPISSLVMSWRKLNVTQSKIVYPILNLAQHSSRIHGNCVTCTLTGRISMHEPNLQNVPRDFSSEDNSFTISVRMAFTPAVGNVMLAADYCQLELRILAHFSRDATLCDIMRKPGDIFKNIAAKWNHVSESQVDDKMRQHTKQLCYGMIYGMGVKTLAENLSVDEERAKEFLNSFMSAYPGISKWLTDVINEARMNGYITTILERRRMFPGLASTNPTEKSQAERQAVNTKVQGSAADIAKKAMVNIEERMRFEFPSSATIMSTVNCTRKLRSRSRESQQRGGYLVLQLHDELLYEVNINDLKQVAKIVKESMEEVCQLAVPLPVKLKVGPAWGDLSEYNTC